MVGEAKEEAVGREPCRTELGPVEGLDLQARYNSGRVAGDFYDAIRVGTRVAFLLSDIAGHRVDAHPIAAAAQEVFRKSAAEFFGPADANLMDATAQLVQVTNLALIRASKGVHFAPTFLGCFDVELGVLAYINAGGQTAVISDSDGTRFLPNVSMPMGLFTHLTYEPSMQAFERGAKLLVVTKRTLSSRAPSSCARRCRETKR